MASTSRTFSCKYHPDSFCFICGHYIIGKVARKITPVIKNAYLAYFGFAMTNEDKPWTPSGVCGNCSIVLNKWINGEKYYLAFGVPAMWKQVVDHSECYFCVINLNGVNKTKRKSITYPEVASVRKPVPHSNTLPRPRPPQAELDTSTESEASFVEISSDTYDNDTRQHLIAQNELNDLIRDLKLSKCDAELLASRLQQKNCLEESVKVSEYRSRDKNYSVFFSKADNVCYCNNIEGLFETFGTEHKANDWRLFIDSSKYSLKAALVHNGNRLPTVPVAHAVGVKENYEQFAVVLELIKYNKYKWHLCADLKVVAIVTGLQGGFTKFCCFLCHWDSRAKSQHYIRSIWPVRQQFEVGAMNVANPALIEASSIILPPLHIKLGLMKNFVKALDVASPAFQYLVTIFPKLSLQKIKEGVFDGPQIRKLMKNDNEFVQKLSKNEAQAWLSFKALVHGFLGNNRDENYVQIVKELLQNYHAIRANMSLKLHFLHSHLDFFPPNLGAESDEQGERFHQDLLTLEKRYQGHWDERMLGDYCWTVIRETNPNKYKKVVRHTHFQQYTQ